MLGHLRRHVRRWPVLHGLLVAQLMLPPFATHPVVMAAGMVSTISAPSVITTASSPNTSWLSPTADPRLTLDSDGDYLLDDQEASSGTDAFNPDTDHDGLSDYDEIMVTGTNPLSTDSNADGISDYNAFYGCTTVNTLRLGAGASACDWDGDGLKDPVDPDPLSALNIPDSDGDHVPDSEDSHPMDPGLWNDRNGNGLNDDAEPSGADLDGDGVSDRTDSHPADPALYNDWNFNGLNDPQEDWDDDGVSNLQDSHPGTNALWCDWNGNGVNDDAESTSTGGLSANVSAGGADTDGDGYADDRDSHPADASLWNDHDGNGVNDEAEASADTDRDGIADVLDAFPEDRDNDGLSDAGEQELGTDASESDSDGDGLSDSDEVHLGTNPLKVDTDGDGLTDGEEVQAYHTDPLEATRLIFQQQASETVDPPPAPALALGISQKVPAPDTWKGSRFVAHVQGAIVGFPSKSALTTKADLSRTLILTNTGTSALSRLSASLSGPDAAQFRLGVLSSADLAAGATSALTVSFLAPTPTTTVRSATLTFSAAGASAPLFTLQLRSVVNTGLWAANDDYFSADYTDADQDGIPDLVEAMYLPLIVTAEGDLDGDGVSNVKQYRAGRDLRAHATSTDVDGDGLTNVMEDAWNAAYPGRLNKYYFPDALDDPDGDGLLTIEELTCSWGGAGKDPLAVATHPFLASSAPPSASKTATYKVTTRTPPKAGSVSNSYGSYGGDLLSRPSLYAAWMNDGQLRLATHEAAALNDDKLPTDFFTAERVVHAATTALQTTQGSDHLPRGYIAWLARQTPPVNVPNPLSATPPTATSDQLFALGLPKARYSDDDGMPAAWEAAYDLDWRNAADGDLTMACAELTRQGESIAARRRAIQTELGSLTGTVAAMNLKRTALNQEDARLEAEYEALTRVLGRLTPGSTTWEGWTSFSYAPTVQDQTVNRDTYRVPMYAVAEAKFPTALAAAPATTWSTRRTTWIDKQMAALYWHVLATLDPDHDGLMNADEQLQNLNPRLPDYAETSGRDTDGDGFTDAMELTTGTDPLSAAKKPVYAIDILTPASERTSSALLPLEKPLRLQTVLRGPGGAWPLAGQSLAASAPDNLTLLAWGIGGVSPTDWNWYPKNQLAAVTTDAQGIALLYVNPSWKKGSLSLTLKSTPGNGAPAGLKAASATCSLTVSTSATDTDADGLPDAWETQAAQNELPAIQLNKSSALDAEAGAWHFGYHPATPMNNLPDAVRLLLNNLKAEADAQGFLPDYPGTAASHSVIAVPTTDSAATTARHRILALIDPDHDGWSNLEEYQYGTHPRYPDNPATGDRDSDGDGVSNFLELKLSSNPFNAASKPNPAGDTDKDGLTYREETTIYRTDPTDPDTDGDGLKDGWEALYFDPAVNNLEDAADYNDPGSDPDSDGLSNQQEERLGTSPRSSDTDGDGDSDYLEQQSGTAPLDPKVSLARPGGVASGSAATAPAYQTLFPSTVVNAPEVRLGVSCSIVTGNGMGVPGNYLVSVSNKYNVNDTTFSNARLGSSFPEIGTFSVLSDFYDRGLPMQAGKTCQVRVSPSTTVGVEEGLLSRVNEVYCTLDFRVLSGESDAILLDAPVNITIPVRHFYNGVRGASHVMCSYTFDLHVPWVRTQALATFPTDRARKKFGVGEEAWVAVKPDGLNTFLTDRYEDSVLGAGTSVRLLKFASMACAPSMGMSLGAYSQSFVFWDPESGGVTPLYYPVFKNRPQVARARFSVVEPASESAVKLAELAYPKTMQGVGMELKVQVQPSDVSFYNVEMREVDLGTEGVTGVFAQMNPARLVHRVNPNWLSLNQNNQWKDLAEFQGFPRQEWGPGAFEWKIGVEWRVRDGGGNAKRLPTNRRQVHELVDFSGSSRITKMFGTQMPGPQATRNLNGSSSVDLALDANRDGTIESGETASQAKPFRFWINDDFDPHADNRPEADETLKPDYTGADWWNPGIDGIRDLEDFTRLHVNLPSYLVQKAKNGEAQIGFKWSQGSGRIRIYRATDADGSLAYLQEYDAALAQQFAAPPGGPQGPDLVNVRGSASSYLSSRYWSNIPVGATKLCFLFEGCETGKGKLSLVVRLGTSSEIIGPGVWIKLMNVQSMFERGKVAEPYAEPDDIPDAWVTGNNPDPVLSHASDISGYPFEADPDETKQYIVHVHGWRMDYEETQNWAQTTFKRLWHHGYKGRFAAFRWPTFSAGTDLMAALNPVNGRLTYNDSEYRAWLSGKALADYVNSLPSGYVKNVMAHSMGNVVTGAAFRAGMSGVSRYAMFNAAMAHMAYGTTQREYPTRATPDTASDAATNSLGLYNKFNPMATTAINFYLTEDFAMSAWQFNHAQNKPEIIPSFFTSRVWSYFPNFPREVYGATLTYPPGLDGIGQKMWCNIQVGNASGVGTLSLIGGRQVNKLPESMAYVAQSRSKPAGNTDFTAGSVKFSESMDGYGFGKEHSAEWVHSIQKTFECFTRLLKQFGIDTNPN